MFKINPQFFTFFSFWRVHELSYVLWSPSIFLQDAALLYLLAIYQFVWEFVNFFFGTYWEFLKKPNEAWQVKNT
jgi:hypothetical protein